MRERPAARAVYAIAEPDRQHDEFELIRREPRPAAPGHIFVAVRELTTERRCWGDRRGTALSIGWTRSYRLHLSAGSGTGDTLSLIHI